MRSECERLIRIKSNLERRALIFDLTRLFFKSKGYLEVETPIRCPAIAPERFIFPENSDNWFLAASPELHMKRLLASGFEKIFQITKCFRRGEQGRLHNPEFSMIEWYATGSDYMGVMSEVEELVCFIASKLNMGTVIPYQGVNIDISRPWPKITVLDALNKYAGWTSYNNFNDEMFDDDITLKVIPRLSVDRPCILYDYPREAASLAKIKDDNPDVAERTEVFLAELEIANAYSELIDPVEQRLRFESDIETIKITENRNLPLPEKFLDAVGDMKPTGGIALGMDRLVMLFCDASNIEDVMAFPNSFI